MKISILLILSLISVKSTFAQSYSVVPNSDRIIITNVDQLTIIGYEGNEVIFNNPHFKNNKKTQSENLQLIKNEPFDETDIGLSVSNSNTGLKVVQVLQNNSCDDDFKYVIRIPEHMDIKYKHSSWDGEDLLIENVMGEIEISTNHNDIYLKEVTGPMAIKTVYGSIEAQFKFLSQKGSVSLYSVYEHVDITLPEQSACKVNLKTMHGHIFSDLDINLDKEISKDSESQGDNIMGNLNGGGVDLTISATYDNIYLRKAN